MPDEMNLKEKYGDRKAYEWFVRWQDQWYWNRAKNKVARLEKKMTVLIGVSTAISIVISLAIHFSFLSYSALGGEPVKRIVSHKHRQRRER